MAITPIGQMRVNPNTFMSEVWDGTKWVDTVTPHMINSSGSLNGSSYISANVNSNITTSRVKQTFSPTEKELMFEFLKDNLRVAEYRDGNGKIENVELQLRLDAGYEWEPIRRVKITRTKL